ncbi:MAG: ribbon-helix-helix protein, CopG family [Myxococcales bacterium]|nr:ribbon-helix-helix protein, CopG family [Myxococcales bacterium]
MTTMAVKVPEQLLARLDRESKRRRVRRSELVRDALQRYLADDRAPQRITVADLAADLIGCVQGGPTDLSHNPAHLTGFGR